MTSRFAGMRLLVFGFTAVLAFGFAMTAEAAKARKHRHSGAPVAAHGGGQWGGNLVQTGPLYYAQEYLGTDPDPNIRFQLLRDITGRYGGGGD
jgi:hypothetical protein